MPANSEIVLDGDVLALLIADHQQHALPRLKRLWDYYRNQAMPAPAWVAPGRRHLRLAQEQGLPPRLTRASDDFAAGEPQREIVIENDIAWRLHTLVDFMFGRPFVLQSLASSDAQARRIEEFLQSQFEAAGGLALFQDAALLGSIYGYIDFLVRLPAAGLGGQSLGIELVDGPRAIPLLNRADYRVLDAFIIPGQLDPSPVPPAGWFARLRGLGQRLAGIFPEPRPHQAARTEVWTTQSGQVFVDGLLVQQELNRLGRLPVVHLQNLPQPFFFEGLSDVEPLIPLQDELNTRLCDRANRITFQAFKMYLGKGLGTFCDKPVRPGQMWATDNPDASIQEFGGDAASPSEDTHITEIRDAMDKTSGVNAIAAGLLRDKIGNLTSENALRIVLIGLLAKTEKRRVTYGQGIAALCELLLHAADVTGLLPNARCDRRVRLDWPSPLPENTAERLAEAKAKLDLGVPRTQVLAELGYRDIA